MKLHHWPSTVLSLCLLPSASPAQMPSGMNGSGFEVRSLYPRVAVGRSIDLLVSYSNAPFVENLFAFTENRPGITIAILDSNAVPIAMTQDQGQIRHGDQHFPATAGGVRERDLILPGNMTPKTEGNYFIEGSYHFTDTHPQTTSFTVFAPRVRFEVVPPGTPTPERPRPWEDYNKDPSLYPELKRHLLAMPLHRFGRAALSAEVWLEVLCDPEFPKERRMLPVESLLQRPRPYHAKLLPLALDEKTDEDVRLRALMLLGGMERNEDARSELVKRFWLKDDAGQKSALYRMAFLYGYGRGTGAIPYGTVDPDPRVRSLALFPLAQSGRAQEVLAVAATLTNCAAAFPTNLFPSGEWMTSYQDVAAAAADYAGSARRALEGRIERKPVSPPADAAEQAEAVRKLFH